MGERGMTSRDERSLNPLRYASDFIAPGAGGRRVFTLLLPETCRYSCSFCPMSPVRRLPEAFRSTSGLARLFLTAFRRGLCDGLFVTAGIPRQPVRGMARVLELVELLRVQHGFRGYIHVKSVPGATPGQVEKVVHLADRVSYQHEPACRRALLEFPMGRPPRAMELFSSPERAVRELRAALVESARRAPGSLPPLPDGPDRRGGQLPLFGAGSPLISEHSARR
jgi:predicted DNA-binding helix-hairpin-helix protein